ncbi:MAG: DUF4214 domain-containing protein [Actinobacteria bacterium]|nr:DUF4214 domain-containing protein [Actinomycetota bacterium]
MALLIVCPFLLIFKLNTLAEYFANYVYGFLVLGVIGYFFDKLREKLKSRGTIKIYKKVFLSILVIFLLSSTLIFVKEYRRNSDYTVVIKENFIENFIKFAANTKDKYIKTFRKDIYYSGLDVIEVDGKKISRDIIINIDNPKAGSIISKTIDLSGWAIETNSIDNTGIDKIEFFFDGIPGKGKYLGSFSIPYYKSDIETVKFLENLYLQFYNRKPFKGELSYWTINLECRILSRQDVVLNIVKFGDVFSKGFINRNLKNEDFVKVLYRGLFNRETEEGGLKYWTDILNGFGATRYEVFMYFVYSKEFKIRSGNYYNTVPLRKETLNIMRKGVGEKYGSQFYLSGFNFKFDSTKYKNSKHSIYIYVHSPIFGWDYKTLIINIEN